jgi:hypothetical protein
MIFHPLGKYILLLKAVFRRPEKWSIYRKEIFHEMVSIGVGSFGIIAIISVFLVTDFMMNVFESMATRMFGRCTRIFLITFH